VRCSPLVDWPVYPRLRGTMLTTTPKRNPRRSRPRPSEGHAQARRELQRGHPADRGSEIGGRQIGNCLRFESRRSRPLPSRCAEHAHEDATRARKRPWTALAKSAGRKCQPRAKGRQRLPCGSIRGGPGERLKEEPPSARSQARRGGRPRRQRVHWRPSEDLIRPPQRAAPR
jgi:hypothetical protein